MTAVTAGKGLESWLHPPKVGALDDEAKGDDVALPLILIAGETAPEECVAWFLALAASWIEALDRELLHQLLDVRCTCHHPEERAVRSASGMFIRSARTDARALIASPESDRLANRHEKFSLLVMRSTPPRSPESSSW